MKRLPRIRLGKTGKLRFALGSLKSRKQRSRFSLVLWTRKLLVFSSKITGRRVLSGSRSYHPLLVLRVVPKRPYILSRRRRFLSREDISQPPIPGEMMIRIGETRKIDQWVGTAALLFFLSVLNSTAQSQSKNDENSSQACTANAWEAYKGKDFVAAADRARDCIYFFQGKANSQEKEMEDAKQPDPPKGEVSDPKVRADIFKRGQLNDVATCYFIVGSSYERLYLKKMKAGAKKDDEDRNAAIEAFKSACKYKYARTAAKDLNSFWSPAEESTFGLQRLGAS
jgi:hypothetical protein